ncbi:MFS transporter [Halapricum hydrolyticum]|uniref:MFS transporter n=1 Tax=Halapricum hydrolyticum TaxID=2979991 RepID=A0AAE3IBV5_9EURY|nr:MFS transporter [Halapricum hydrolyticum]MCU4717775.1 MFS transporter [Halapricum hydrolyticum]MCU4726939.1 MFS transporter [Halapricum hydrolyticum]
MNPLQSVRQSVGALRGEGHGRILVAIASGWGLLVGTRMTYPVLLPYFRAEYGLSLSVAGLLVTILWLGSAIGQLPGGILADRYSERRVLTAGLSVVAAALTAVVLAPGPTVVFLATGLVGIGLSLYPIARITVLSSIYPDSVGRALGMTMATGDVGQTVLPPAIGFVAAGAAWQLGLGALVPVFLVLATVVWVVVPDGGTDSGRDGISAELARDVFAVLRTRTMALVTVVLFFYILVWQSFTGFYPTYLVEVKGFSESVAGAVFALFFGFGVVVKPIAGTAYDRFGMRTSLLSVLIGPVAGLAALPFLDGFWPIVALTALVSTMLGSGAITQSYLADAIPEDIRGTGLGVVRTTAASLGALGPVAFGSLADRGYFDAGYVVLAGLMVLIVALTTRMPRSS